MMRLSGGIQTCESYWKTSTNVVKMVTTCWVEYFISNIIKMRYTFMEISTNYVQLTLLLLGDSGYPLRPWLLTPLENEPEPGTPEAAFNAAHKTCRASVERCIGVLKGRFRCLLKHRVLHYAPDVCAHIINACAVLHNMCTDNNVPEPDEPGDDIEMMGNPENHQGNNEHNIRNLAAGRRLQHLLIRNYFT